MKKIIVKIISIILITIFLTYSIKYIFPLISIAVTESELNDVNTQIDNKEQEIEEIQEEISQELEEAKKLTVQISEYESEIEELESQISDLEEKIEEAAKEIAEKEEEYNTQKELLDEKVIAMAESGETTYLDVMFASASLTEMISNYYLMSEVIDYDLDLMEKVQNQKEEIENEKAELEADKQELDVAKDTLESKMGQLEVAKQEKEEAVEKLSEEEKNAQEQLEELQATQKAIETELARIAAEEDAKRQALANSSSSGDTTTSIITGNPSASGYIFPLAGKTKADITTGYGSYSWGGTHTGVDVAIAAGTPVYAVKDGTVVTSTALKNSSGNYTSYGEYIVISHGDGTMTLYAHGLAGSRLVSAGDTVVQGQQIMSVGSTGNSTGNHLHFEVRVNGKAVNPVPYLP